MVVKGKLDDRIRVTAVVDAALKKIEAGAVVVEERAGVAVDLFVDLVDQFVELSLFVRRHLKMLDSLDPLTQGARADALPVSSDQGQQRVEAFRSEEPLDGLHRAEHVGHGTLK